MKSMRITTAYGQRFAAQEVETCFGRTAAELSEMLSRTKLEKRDDDDDDGDDEAQGIAPAKTDTDDQMPTGIEPPLPANRVFTNAWITVQKSPLGGYGIFATKDILAYTTVLVECPFLRTHSARDERNRVTAKYHWLGEEQKAVYDGLHGFSIRHNDEIMKKFDANRYVLTHSYS